MNQSTRYVLGIYQVGVIVRDSLEYGIPKDHYDKNAYEQRKLSIRHGVEANSPFVHFLNQNGEVGKEIQKNMSDFIDLVYGDESRVVSIDGDVVKVDPAFSTQVFDYVVGLHETISDVVKGFIQFSKTNDTFEEELDVLMTKDDLFYRSITSLVLTDAMHRLFLEFNKTMNDAKGKENPQSTFVLNDLKKVIGFFRFVKEHSKITDEKFVKNIEASEHVIALMSGQEKPEDGADIRSQIIALHEEWTKECQVAELDWKKTYVELWQQLADFEKSLQEAAKKAD